MLVLAALSNIDVVGWTCFLLGIGVLLTGVIKGTLIDHDVATKDAKKKIEEAAKKIDETKTHITLTTAEGLPAGGADAQVSAAQDSADEARSALEQVGDIVGALPEKLRFSGLLVLIGTVLMSVATIQFGHISLF